MWAFKEKCWHKKNIYILVMLEIPNETTQALFHLLYLFLHERLKIFTNWKNACLCITKTGTSDFRLCLGIDMLLADFILLFPFRQSNFSVYSPKFHSFLYEGNNRVSLI